MSTPPKEPKPGAGSALEQTFLGVAPAVPEPPSAPAAGGTAASGSAIIAAPMISVSGERKARAPATPAVAVSPPVSPARPAALQGGWQSAGVPRPQAPDQTALHGTPGAWPAARPPVAQPPAASPARGLPPRPDAQAYSPRPAPTHAVTHAGAQRAVPQNPAPASPAGSGLHHTALASDYLRAARDVALGAGPAQVPPRATTPAQPSVESLPARSLQPQLQRPAQLPAYPQPARAYEPSSSGPPTQMPVSDPLSTASSVAQPASAPAVTAAPPATAPLSEPGPLPYAGGYQRAPLHAPEPEPLHGPRSIGTQASVAPPLSGADGPAAASPRPLASPLAQAMLAPAPNPVRSALPQPLAGTMMERTPSIPGNELPPTGQPPSSVAHSATAGFSTRFEQVPSARGSLAQQVTGFGLQIPIDQSASDWGRTGLEQAGAGKAKAEPGSPLRLILLAALAIAAIGFAAFGKQLLVGPQGRSARAPASDSEQQQAEADSRTPDQATLTNLPGPTSASTANAPVANALPAGTAPSAGLPAAQAVGVAPIPYTAPGSAPLAAGVPSVPASTEKAEALVSGDAKTAEAAATPESRLAAQAARHVLAARYAEALPLYRQLQQSYPQNSAYAAMARVLEQKVATTAKSGAQP